MNASISVGALLGARGAVSGLDLDLLAGAAGLDRQITLPYVQKTGLALAGFDEYLLGYKDRSLMIDAAGMKGVIPGGNGVFRATLVRDGKVMATWKRTLTPKAVKVEIFPLKRVTKAQQKQAAAALEPYADYLERDLQVTWA